VIDLLGRLRTAWTSSGGPRCWSGSASTRLGLGLAHGLRNHDLGTQLPRLLGAVLIVLPAAWVLLGLTMALFGLAPRLTALSWAAVLLFLLPGQFGPILRLDQRVMDISPYSPAIKELSTLVDLRKRR
jgi:putative exporter of polyketide antibiotics